MPASRPIDRADEAARGPGGDAPGRIGPNAIIRLAEALRTLGGEGVALRVFERVGLARYLAEPPAAMVDEREVAALYGSLLHERDAGLARAAARDAGRRTAEYLLGNRIPAPAQLVLRGLPPWAASRLLVAAIRRHAWTFAGSARFTARPVPHGLRLSLVGNPMCRGVAAEEAFCGFYAATFERLFRELVSPRASVREVACEAVGAPACVFAADWSRGD